MVTFTVDKYGRPGMPTFNIKKIRKLLKSGVRAIMQTVTLSEFCRIVKKDLNRGRREVEPCVFGRKPWNV